MGWRDLINRRWKHPYLCVVTNDSGQRGTGLLVDPRHVLTASHVVKPHGRSEAEAERARRSTISQPLPVALSSRVQVDFAPSLGHPIGAKCTAQHRYHDVVLVELDEPLYGVSRPRFADLSRGGKVAVVALGFIRKDAGEFELDVDHQTGQIDLDKVLWHGETALHLSTDFGAQGGFSGGPVFLADDEAQPSLAGISRLGGDALDHGKIVAADIIKTFLEENRIDVSADPAVNDANADLVARGYAPNFRLAVQGDGPDLVFAALSDPKRPDDPPTFVAIAPISAATSRGLPADDIRGRRPEHFARPEEIDALIRRINRTHSVRARLMRYEEHAALARLWPEPSAPPLYGEPLWLHHFADDNDRPLAAPDDVCEWAMTASGPNLFVHRGAELRRQRGLQLRPDRLVARLALDTVRRGG
ncbi:MAG: serine protease [Ancalomicrobiaceae bacterium]|nr:serine protease [Ancalomicrobiaceae bacterium]